MTNKGNNHSDEATIDYKDLYAEVGRVFFVWSNLEVALKKSIAELMADQLEKPPHGIARMLDRWKDLHASVTPQSPAHLEFTEEVFSTMSEGLAIRNRLAHGLAGWSVEDGSMNKAYFATIVNSEERTIYLAELRSVINQLSVIASQMNRITSIAVRPEVFSHFDLYGEFRSSLHKYKL